MRAGSRSTVSWPGIGPLAAICASVASSVILQPCSTMLPSSSSIHTAGEPLKPLSGSVPDIPQRHPVLLY